MPAHSTRSSRRQRFRARAATQKAVLALSAGVVAVCLAGAGALVYGKQQLDERLQTESVAVATTMPAGPSMPAPPPSPTETTSGTDVPVTFPAAEQKAQNFLITGSDTDACVDPNSPWADAAGRTAESTGNRSDTIMLMRIDPDSGLAAVLSFPRDLWVRIPGHGKNRINSAYVEDDYSLLAQTIYDNFGIIVDHYIQVDFCAFKRIVDAVGGVTVPFATRIVDKQVGLDVAAGCHTFSGDEALAYVRSRHLRWVDAAGTRHEDPFADLGRISRQQDFLRRILQAALDKGLFDPAIARALIGSLQTEVVTEHGFTINDILGLAGVLKDIDPDTIATYQIETSRLKVGEYDVLQPEITGETMVAILGIFRDVAPPAPAPSVTAVPGATGSTGPAPSVQPQQKVTAEILPDDSINC